MKKAKVMISAFVGFLLIGSIPSLAFAQGSSDLALDLSQVTFSQQGQELKILQSDFLEVYREDETVPVDIHVSGQLYGEKMNGIKLLSTLLPTFTQATHLPSDQDSAKFSITIHGENLPSYQSVTLILHAVDEQGQRSTSQTLGFMLRPFDEYPSIFQALSSVTQDNLHLLAISLLLLVMVFIWKSYGLREQKLIRRLGFIVLIIGFGSIVFIMSTKTMAKLMNQGLLIIPGQENTVQKKSSEQILTTTLTQLNENLEVAPALATSWSNISPLIWEFKLRRSEKNTLLISADEVITSLRRKAAERAFQPLLSSLKQIVGFHEDQLQLITHFPDPILPQKLSKVPIDLQDIKASPHQLYLPLEQFSDHVRSKRNEEYFGLGFLKNVALYQTELIRTNPKSLIPLIKSRSLDLLDEPDPLLWPVLSQSGYKILPKINTESVMLLVNRNSVFLKEKNLIAALKEIFKSPRILQSSYFQYGQLANQFAPPGVFGYHPKLEIRKESRSTSELMTKAKKNLGDEKIILRLRFPEEEQRLASIIVKELEQAGIVVEPEISNTQAAPVDLTLLPLNFDLGDVEPFLDALIDSRSPVNKTYSNPEVDQLILQARTELRISKRLEVLQTIMQIIVEDDPAGIPLLFKKSFIAKKKEEPVSWVDRWLQRVLLGWE